MKGMIGLLILVLTNRLEGSDDVCPVEVRVPRNTITSAGENSPVTLRCPVKHCGWRPAVTWCKIWNNTHCITVNATDNIKIQWKNSETEPNISTSELIFTRVSMGDAGLYRCGVYGDVTSVSHTINVSVIDCWWSRSADAPLIMSCRAAFENPATVTWCKQDGGLCTPLEDKDKYSLMWLQPSPAWGVSYLTVYNIGAADSGEYHCHASPAGPCVTGDVLSSPIRLLASGDVVKQCGQDVTGPPTVGILNIVQIVEITVLLGSFAAFNVYWRLKLSAYRKGRSSPVQLTEDDTPRGDPIQAETENDTELDYDDCSTV
ncbi:uncharacterized protein [Paramormyrops kingsleyae]|uniref:uncharacterized protein isoform X2 n=1 Tax=Paramormyrops kingsleyae TaxID=1676925 RepID=UPI003B96B5BC